MVHPSGVPEFPQGFPTGLPTLVTGGAISDGSHGLRQQLTVLTGYLEFLDRHWEDLDDGDHREFLRRALDAARREAGLLDFLVAEERRLDDRRTG